MAAFDKTTVPREQLLALGKSWEPDFLLLRDDEANSFRLVAACVCFPSSWPLEEKVGRPIAETHAPAPTLNATFGAGIDQFLGRIRPSAAWARSNWGLSRSPALNQHPSQHTPRLGSPLRADEVWLRVENQIFFRLPETGGLLFGIRIENASLSDVKKWPDAARGLPRALRTMPEEIARYKGIITAREEIAPLL